MVSSISQRWVFCLLVLAAVVFGRFPTQSVAQEPQIRDPDFRQDGRQIIVTYDLIGQKGEEYEVTLLLSRSGGEAFDYQPDAVSGHVGGGVSPGLDKQITWNVLEDFPDGLQGANVQFRLEVEKDGGNSWLYVLGSAVLAGGGGTAAAILTGLIGGSSGGSGGGGNGESGSGGDIPPPDGPPN